MSGGVDSSVAALLLHRQGYDVIGITMRMWAEAPGAVNHIQQSCCSVEDVEDARRVAQIIGIPHYVMNVEREFGTHVMDYFVAEYQRGRTPHPCIACNDRIKFGSLMRRAESLGAGYVATGHYARIQRETGSEKRMLLRGVDETKDQSYVLFGLSQELLCRLLFPVGEYSKEEIRELAFEAGMSVAGKPDSQEICFVPGGDYREFLRERVQPQPGEMVTADGASLGTHQGIENFTVGQRRGLGVATGERLFVSEIDPKTRRVMLGREQDLYHVAASVEQVSYSAGDPPSEPRVVKAKIRYNARPVTAVLEPDGARAILRFDMPQRALSPGQAAVFYDGEALLGGGFIDRPLD